MNVPNNPLEARGMNYTDLVSLLKEENKPPGGHATVKSIIINTFVNPAKQILEVGSNTGFTSIQLASLTSCSCIGIDPSVSCIEVSNDRARRLGVEGRCQFQIGYAENLNFADNSMDVVVCGGALAWVSDQEKAFAECFRVIKPNGFLVIVPLWYMQEPPEGLIGKLNDLLGIKIKNWGRDYWINKALEHGFLIQDTEDCGLQECSPENVESFLRDLISNSREQMTAEIKDSVLLRALEFFLVFRENNKYLKYTRIFCRKPFDDEQKSLF